MSRASALRQTGRRQRAGSDDVTIRRHRPDYKIILFMGLLMMVGLVIMYAIGPQRANVLNTLTGSSLSEDYFFFKQAVSLAVALVVFIFMAILPFKILEKWSAKLFLGALAASALLAVADLAGWGIAQESLGATRWFNFGFISFQPAELLKLGVLVFAAVFLGRRAAAGEVNDLHKTLIPLGVITALAMFFVIFLQKDMGTGIVLVAILMTMLFVAGVKKKILWIIIAALAAAMVLMIAIAPHRIERVVTFLSGDNVQVDDANGYHIAHAKIAIGSGGMFGVGIGNSVQATGYLPEAINDSVFAIMGETFGFIGLVVILLLFTALIMQLIKLTDRLPDARMRILVAGVVGWFSTHVVLNIAAMVGLIPLTGITLPLLSYGGTSMVFIAAALGAAFQASHYSAHGSVNKEVGYANLSSRRGLGRSRYASRRRTSRA